MVSRLTVVLVSLLLATPAVILCLWLIIHTQSVVIQCPEECRCNADGIYVNCSYLGLKIIPSIVPTQVQILLLNRNDIPYLENDSFVYRGLVELEILILDFCKLRKIEFGAFNGLTTLRYLSMASNEISELIPGTFEKISSTEYLNLEDNEIEHLERDVFYGLVNVTHLYLEGNQLQYLHPDTFLGLPKLQTLHL
jgi:netrin-G3 ligand